MNEPKNTVFKEQVLQQFLALKNVSVTKQKLLEIQADQSRLQNKKPIDKFFAKIAIYFGGQGIRLAEKKRTIAKELLSQEFVRRSICSAMDSNFSGTAFNESDFVAKVVDGLFDASLDSIVNIEKDEELFGAICIEISTIGVDKFCHP